MMRKRKSYLLLLVIIIGIIFLGKILQLHILLPLVEEAYDGNSFDYLNKILAANRLKNPEIRNLGYYQGEVPKYVNRLILLSIYVTVFLWIILKNNLRVFKNFFLEKKSAFSLALLRVVVFLLLIFLNFPSLVIELQKLGTDSIVPPLGWPESTTEFLIQPIVIWSLGISFQVFCIGSLLGFYTRYMIWGATITGFFVMGIPQFYGKIDHYHILWHMLLLLSFAESGRSLSIDAWRQKLPQINLASSREYGIPIKLTMILIGLGYFFPGFWKYAFSGFEWIFSNNLQLKLHSKWLDLGGWVPAFRVDRYPLLYQSGALLTVIIELGFIFAIFFKKTRMLFVIAAIGFHISVYYFMKILFLTTMALYVVFIDWEKIVPALSNKFFKINNNHTLKPLVVRKFIMVGGVLVSGYLLSGALLINSWPFAVYPTFASIESATVPSILIEVNDESKVSATIPLLDSSYKDAFTNTAKLRGFIRNLITSTKVDTAKYIALIKIYRETEEELSPDTYFRFYEIRLNTNPDSFPYAYEKQALLFSYPLK